VVLCLHKTQVIPLPFLHSLIDPAQKGQQKCKIKGQKRKLQHNNKQKDKLKKNSEVLLQVGVEPTT
jgi:hypothetical protein